MTIPGAMKSSDLPDVLQPTLHGIGGAATEKSADAVLAQFRSPVPRGLPPRVLQGVREHIDTHLESNISLEVLAGIAGLSISRFARALEQSEGVTPHEYVMQRRVGRALELLAGTDMSLAEIACTSGFSDQSHLERQFRAYVGTTPGNYRWLML